MPVRALLAGALGLISGSPGGIRQLEKFRAPAWPGSARLGLARPGAARLGPAQLASPRPGSAIGCASFWGLLV